MFPRGTGRSLAGVRRLVQPQRQRRDDGHRVDRRLRAPVLSDRHHQHQQRGHGAGRADRVGRRPAARRAPLLPSRGGRNLGRRSQRHLRLPREEGARVRGAGCGRAAARWRRATSAAAPACSASASRAASARRAGELRRPRPRPVHRGRPGAVQLRAPPAAPDCGHPGGSGAQGARAVLRHARAARLDAGTRSVRDGIGGARRIAPGDGARLDHRGAGDRRAAAAASAQAHRPARRARRGPDGRHRRGGVGRSVHRVLDRDRPARRIPRAWRAWRC